MGGANHPLFGSEPSLLRRTRGRPAQLPRPTRRYVTGRPRQVAGKASFKAEFWGRTLQKAVGATTLPEIKSPASAGLRHSRLLAGGGGSGVCSCIFDLAISRPKSIALFATKPAVPKIIPLIAIIRLKKVAAISIFRSTFSIRVWRASCPSRTSPTRSVKLFTADSSRPVAAVNWTTAFIVQES